jgi:RimJ/RimL family protein N-acetyltransferase
MGAGYSFFESCDEWKMTTVEIKPLAVETSANLLEHFTRHRRESGVDGMHFMPFAPDDPDGPEGVSVEKVFWPLDKPGWQRWFCAHDTTSGTIIGHVNLKSDSLKAGLHRCELGMGIEKAYRGLGLGKALMERAINFSRGSKELSWIDLRVFAHNSPALALYRKSGFTEVGILRDRFRIQGQSIDDIVMVLNVAN